jgi:hypothetical protein
MLTLRNLETKQTIEVGPRDDHVLGRNGDGLPASTKIHAQHAKVSWVGGAPSVQKLGKNTVGIFHQATQVATPLKKGVETPLSSGSTLFFLRWDDERPSLKFEVLSITPLEQEPRSESETEDEFDTVSDAEAGEVTVMVDPGGPPAEAVPPAQTSAFASELREEDQAIRAAFSSFDSDGSGFISPAELSNALVALDTSNTGLVNQVPELLEAFDKNQDGQIDFAEFCELALVLKQKHQHDVTDHPSIVLALSQTVSKTEDNVAALFRTVTSRRTDSKGEKAAVTKTHGQKAPADAQLAARPPANGSRTCGQPSIGCLINYFTLVSFCLYFLFPFFAIAMGVVAITHAAEIATDTRGYGTDEFIATRGRLCESNDDWDSVLFLCHWYGVCTVIAGGCHTVLFVFRNLHRKCDENHIDIVDEEVWPGLAFAAWCLSHTIVSLI